MARTTAPDQAALDGLGLPRLMMSPEPVPDLGAKAVVLGQPADRDHGVRLEAVDGMTVVRVTLALPEGAASLRI